MTKQDKIKVNEILDALVRQNEYTVLSKASRIVFTAASREPDETFKAKLLMLAGEVQALNTRHG